MSSGRLICNSVLSFSFQPYSWYNNFVCWTNFCCKFQGVKIKSLFFRLRVACVWLFILSKNLFVWTSVVYFGWRLCSYESEDWIFTSWRKVTNLWRLNRLSFVMDGLKVCLRKFVVSEYQNSQLFGCEGKQFSYLKQKETFYLVFIPYRSVLYSQCFGWYVLRPSSGVSCRTEEPT